MPNNSVLLFSRDPGGCNSIAPLYNSLSENYKIILFGKDFSVDRFKNIFNLNPINFKNEVGQTDYNTIEKWISKLNPKFVITGTSHGDLTEYFIWKACHNLKIKTIPILDHWINYKIRFQDESKETQYPDYIIVPDEEGRRLALQEGLPNEKIKPYGNPYYEYLKNYKPSNPCRVIREYYTCNQPNQFLVTFASEPFSVMNKNYGYTEFSILSHLLDSLQNKLQTGQSASVVIRPHPKENIEELGKFTQQFRTHDKLKTYVNSSDHPLELMQASDIVCGMISQFLVEATHMGTPTVSIQIGLDTQDRFFMTKSGTIPLTTTQQELDIFLENNLLGLNKTPTLNKFYKGSQDSINKILELLGESHGQISN